MPPVIITDVITALVGIAQGVAVLDGGLPFVRDLNNTPTALDQGDCPQVFCHLSVDKASRMTFDAPATTTPGHSRRDFTIPVYFIDTMELVPAWDSRPRCVTWVDAFVAAVEANDCLGIVDLYCEPSADVRDGMKFNGVPFRGGVITVKGYFFS